MSVGLKEQQGAIYVAVRYTPIVELDCSLYGISESDFRILTENLRKDPYLGTATEPNRYTLGFGSLVVTYVVHLCDDGLMVIISGIRPADENQLRSGVSTATARVAAALDAISDAYSIVKGGE